MKITQGTFSYLPPLSDEQIAAQIQYALDNDWPLSIEYTDDPHPRNAYWEMWGQPMFDVHDRRAVMDALQACRAAEPEQYIKLNAYDARLGRQTTALSFLVQRPSVEPGFRLDRQEGGDRQIHYTLHAYSMDAAHAARD